MDDTDVKYMQRALQLAVTAEGRTNPNPMVGAVIVKNDQIIGEGFHQKAGTPHAEIHALNSAGTNASGGTIYVTLEPCSHYGRTPPCADAIVKAGIKRAVIATIDPNPRVRGKGLKILEDAGIKTRVGVLENQAIKLNEVFLKYIQTGMPFVAVKTAMTLDGKIASATGSSRWITNETSRHFVHRLRNVYDAILVGIGTVLKDDPLLNTRLDAEDIRDPVRVIIDTNLNLPLESRIAKTSYQQKTIVFYSDNTCHEKRKLLEDAGIKLIQADSVSGLIVMQDVFRILGEMGICSVLVEGGGEINASIVKNELADKVYWFIAPCIIGGRLAPSPVGGAGIELMKDAVKLTSVEIEHLAEDILIKGYF